MLLSCVASLRWDFHTGRYMITIVLVKLGTELYRFTLLDPDGNIHVSRFHSRVFVDLTGDLSLKCTKTQELS